MQSVLALESWMPLAKQAMEVEFSGRQGALRKIARVSSFLGTGPLL